MSPHKLQIQGGNMKRFIYIILFVLISCHGLQAQSSVWDGTRSRWVKGNGTLQNPFLIEEAAHLAYLADVVNAGVLYADSFFVLTVDIDLNHLPWTPIGKDANAFYAGSFDGNYHRINNLNIQDTTYRSGIVYAGLFGYVLDADIRNLALLSDNHIFVSFVSSYNFYVGGIAAYAFASQISNCCFEGSIAVYAYNSYAYVGGILAYCSAGTGMKHCINRASILASSEGIAYAGGIMADGDNSQPLIQGCYNLGNIQAIAYNYTYAGGISAKLNYKASLINCFNSGEINANSNYYAYVGGLTGFGNSVTIRNSFNEGNIYAKAYDLAYAGGLAGFIDYPSEFSNVYNTGDVFSHSLYYKSFAGGIAAYVYNFSHVLTRFTNCYHCGMLTSLSSMMSFSGGIAAEIVSQAELNRCYYLTTSQQSFSNHLGIETNKDFLRSYSILDTFNQSDPAWMYDEDNENEGYPLLAMSGLNLIITEKPQVFASSVMLKAKQFQRSDSITQRGFAFKKLSETVFSYVIVDNESTYFDYLLSSLQVDSLYEYKAFVVLYHDTLYGNSMVFSTAEARVYTLPVSELASHYVRLHGELIYGNDSILAKGFCYKPLSDPDYTWKTIPHAYFSLSISDVLSHTSYMYYAYAVTSSDTLYGETLYFDTPKQFSEVITENTSELGPYSACLHGRIVYGDDSIVTRGFEYKDVSTSYSFVCELLASDTNFSFVLDELESMSDYIYRAFIYTESDTLYGDWVAFSTLQACVLTTHEASHIDLFSAVMHGVISPADEEIFMQGFAWKAEDDTLYQLIQVEGVEVSVLLTDLLPGHTYTYRVFAITENGIFYGNDVLFTTQQYSAELYTYEARDIDVYSAIMHGKIKQGEDPILMQGFEWKAKSESNYRIVQVEGEEISDTLKQLSPNTGYQYRTFILTAKGSMYGEIQEFTTLLDVKLQDYAKGSSMRIFPNPAKDYVQIDVEDKACYGDKIVMVDMYGKCILEYCLTSSSIQLDVSNIAPGMYIVYRSKNNTLHYPYKIQIFR